jgi:myo-inositol 2-dehydrogenase / D-chiro-inositol 1-dehydrogenase
MIRAAIVGAGFAAGLHAESLARTGKVQIVGVVSPTEERRSRFADRWGGRHSESLDEILGATGPDVVVVATPNRFHAEAAIKAFQVGSHVICEKPLATSLADADAMIAAASKAGKFLLYGEELVFAPKYRRVKQLIDEGALGSVFAINHQERHDGPHAAWFFDPNLSGGGALLDMACHGIELSRWLMDRRRVVGVFARVGNFRHRQAAVEDHAVVILRFEDGALATVQGSWALGGGVDERLEVVGDAGSVVADLARGSAMLVHSDHGVGYAAEKAASGPGWSHVTYDEAWHWGWPQQLAHFVDCISGLIEPIETGEEGRATLEIVHAAYQSARTGVEVLLPFHSRADRPIDLFKP